jgi:hypothetical protein
LPFKDFSSEAASQEPSFELPRTHGINDSYSTYIAQASQDPMAQTSMLEEIRDFYGSLPSKNVWLAGLSQGELNLIANVHAQRLISLSENIRISSDFYFEQPQNLFRAHCSQENFGVSPQDLIRNDCRTATDIEQFSQSIDTEMQSLGDMFLFEDSHEQNQETNQSISLNRNESILSASSTPQLPSQPFPGSSRCTGIVLGSQSKSFLQVSEKLRRKRRELAAAQINVSKLLTEIKLLEASSERESLISEAMTFEDTLRHRRSHKRGNDEILQGNKRLKERENAVNFDWEISTLPRFEDGQTSLPFGLRTERCTSVQSLSMQTLPPYVAI